MQNIQKELEDLKYLANNLYPTLLIIVGVILVILALGLVFWMLRNSYLKQKLSIYEQKFGKLSNQELLNQAKKAKKK